MRRFGRSVLVLSLLVSGADARAGMFDGVLDRLGESVGRRTETLGHRAIDGVFDHADAAVECAVRDQACLKRAREEGKPVRLVDEDESDVGPVKCSSGDLGCLQQAQKLGRMVEIE
jgi:hypothetical protein